MTFAESFLEDGLQRAMIDEYFEEELERAGYDGMQMEETPSGIKIVLSAEKPGMVIGKGGKNIRNMTDHLESTYGLDDLSIDVREVKEPDLSAEIVADKLANALERGWYFRKAGQTTIENIMDAGAQGAQIIFSGKLTGARSRVEKFNRGYIKHNGEPAKTIVDEGQGRAVMPLGVIGVRVRIIPPGRNLPDNFNVEEDVDLDHIGNDDIDDLLSTTDEENANSEPDESTNESTDETDDSSLQDEEVID
jgi:small subunit ribosomal protein S3